MIVYHGTPIGGDRQGVTRFLRNRDALVPFLRQEDLGTALEVCRTVILDNSAFTAWKSGEPTEDWSEYYRLVEVLRQHPRFEWAIIPDVIDGSEDENDQLWGEWPLGLPGAPVWHMHESFDRLERMVASTFNCERRLCIGSSGEYSNPGDKKWTQRMGEAMKIICDNDGRPWIKIHGLRMAAPDIASRYPFASVDSTNVAQNASLIGRFGIYPAPSRWQRADAIASRMEVISSPATYEFQTKQEEFALQ